MRKLDPPDQYMKEMYPTVWKPRPTRTDEEWKRMVCSCGKDYVKWPSDIKNLLAEDYKQTHVYFCCPDYIRNARSNEKHWYEKDPHDFRCGIFVLKKKTGELT